MNKPVRFDQGGQRAGIEVAPGIAVAEGSWGRLEIGLLGQFGAAYNAYEQVVTDINTLREQSGRLIPVPEAELATLFMDELGGQETNDALKYVREACVRDPDLQFSLVIQPNTAINAAELRQAGGQFGLGQPERTWIMSPLYEAYTPEELSGATNSDRPVQFLLIPSKPEMLKGHGGITRAEILQGLQEEQPYLRVPPPAAAPTFWYTLRETGSLPTDPQEYIEVGLAVRERTLISHFDLEPKDLGNGLLRMPQTMVDYGGVPMLDDSVDQLSRYFPVARLAVQLG